MVILIRTRHSYTSLTVTRGDASQVATLLVDGRTYPLTNDSPVLGLERLAACPDQQWEPVITVTAAAAGGDPEAAAQLSPVLDQVVQDKDWAALAGVLRRIAGGERGDSLPDGLDPVDTTIAAQALDRLAPPPGPPAQEPR